MNEKADKTKHHVTAMLVVAVVAWYVSVLVRGHASPLSATPGEHFGCLTTAITATTFAVVWFRKSGWKWSMLHPWFVDTPVIEGDWVGTVHRKFKQCQTDPVDLPIKVRIEQPSISVIRFTQTMADDTAEGITEACQLFLDHHGQYHLEGIYQVTKYEDHKETAGDRMSYHGAMRLKLDTHTDTKKLSGNYWSSQFTRGEVVLTRKGK